MIDFLLQDVDVPLWFLLLIFVYRGSLGKLIKSRVPDLSGSVSSDE